MERFWRPWAHFWAHGVAMGRVGRDLKMRSKKETLQSHACDDLGEGGGPHKKDQDGDPDGDGGWWMLSSPEHANVPKGTVADFSKNLENTTPQKLYFW